MQTEVNIGKITLGFFNRVILDNVIIKDKNNKDLLTSSRISCKVNLLELAKGVISIGSIQLYGFDIQLYQEENVQENNFKFLIDAFNKGEKESETPHININSILIRRGKLSWHQWNQPQKQEGFDPNHIVINKITGTLALKELSKDSIQLNVKKISFEEQSGFALEQLSFKIHGNKKNIALNDFKLVCPNTAIQFSPIFIEIDYKNDTINTKETFENLALNGKIEQGTISPSDFNSFFSPLRKWPLDKHLQFNLAFEGDLDHLNIPQLKLYTPNNDFILDAPTEIRHLMSQDQIQVSTKLRNLQVRSTFGQLIAQILTDDIKNIEPYIKAIDFTKVNGNMSYSPDDIKSNLNIATGLGELSICGRVENKENITMSAKSNEIDLSALIGHEKKWGKTSFDIKGDGFIEGNQLKAFGIDGILNKLTYQNYAYKNITFNTYGNGNEYSAEVEIDDSHLQLTANATTNWKSASKHIHLVAEVEQFRPHTLNLTTKHPNTNFSGDIHVGFTGKNIENLEGELCIENFRMESEKETYTQSPITFSIENEDEQKHLLFDSDFMSAEIDGTFNYTSLAGNAQMFMHQYLPNIISAPKIVSKKADELSVFVNIKDLSILEKVLELPLKMEKPGYVSTYFNSENNDLSFNASFPAIAYDQQKVKDVEVIIGQSNDSIECNVKINKEFGSTPVDIVVNATGLDDHIKTNINWSNKINDLYKGHVGINTFFTPNENYSRDISFVIDPSEVTLNDTLWNIHRSQIDITEEHIIVDNFKIENKSHHICVNGQVSDDINDSLHIDLKEINLEYLFDIINFKPVDFGGIATGKAYAVNLKKNAKIEGDVDVQDFTFNHAHLGDLDIIIGWGQEENAININAHIEDPKNNGITDVNGEVRLGAPPRGGLDLMINTQNIDLYFLNKYTKEIFTNMNGRASGWTRVFGPFKGINLAGDMFVTKGSTKVNATNVDYYLANDSVILRPDIIQFKDAYIYDHLGSPGKDEHYAIVNGALYHNSLKNLSYDFEINATNILGFNEKEFGDNTFCGVAYATGKIDIEGEPGKLNINIDAVPEKNTIFSYNQSSPTAISDKQFITYIQKNDSTTAQETTKNEVIALTPESDMNINFRLDLNPSATLKILMDARTGDYIALNGNGIIRANYNNKKSFEMYGTYTVDHGIYKLSIQDLIRKDFKFNKGGTIAFGGDPIKAGLNLQAIYTVPSVSLNDLSARSTFNQNNVRVDCVMNLGGTPEGPKISFDFDIPNVNEDEKQMVRSLISTEEERNMQVVYLLGIGRFYTYDYNNTEQSQSAVAMKSLLSSTLSGQINQMFSTIIGDNSNWNFGTNFSTGEIGWSDMDVEGMLSGRLLNNRLLINGNFGYRDNPTTTNNFIGDFDLQWLLNKKGTFSLKAYSKTNDRYFTKSSLTTQGVGLAVKKDFNSWKDILKLLVPKKMREKNLNENTANQ